MSEKSRSPKPASDLWQLADTLFRLSWRKLLFSLLLLGLAALLTWTLFRNRSGTWATLVVGLGAVLVPLYLLLALVYTIIRTQPRECYLCLNRKTLLLIPAFVLGVVLHNLLFALFFPYFQRYDGDEGVLFIATILGIPFYFLVVLVNTIITALRRRGEDEHLSAT